MTSQASRVASELRSTQTNPLLTKRLARITHRIISLMEDLTYPKKTVGGVASDTVRFGYDPPIDVGFESQYTYEMYSLDFFLGIFGLAPS